MQIFFAGKQKQGYTNVYSECFSLYAYILIYKNKFKGFGQQRCWAIDNIPVKSDWILFIDADEVCTPKFSSAVLDAIRNSKDDTAGFYCCWKLMLYGKWLKFSDSFPRKISSCPILNIS